jgi:hypothetical protein
MLRLIRIRGNSIAPYLRDGEVAVILRPRWLRKPLRKGDFIVFHEKMHGTLIKQIDSLSADGKQFFVRGLDDFSTDSRLFGAIPYEQVKGKVIFRIRKYKSAAG